MRSPLLIALLISCWTVGAQETHQAPTSGLQTELAKLAADAQLLQHDLPSIACNESMLSQLLKKGKTVEEVRLVAEVRVERNSQLRLVEHYQFKELNGSPYSGPEPRTPLFVEGGLAEALILLLPSAQPFLVFTLSPGRLDYKFREGATGQQPFGIPVSTRGFALLDQAGNVTHIERRADPTEATRMRVTDFAAYDLTPTPLNEKNYMLSTRNIAEISHGKETRRFDATLSGCHLFHATSTIVSGSASDVNP